VDNPYLPPVLTLYREAFLWLLADDEAGKRALAVAMDTEPESFLAQIGQDDVGWPAFASFGPCRPIWELVTPQRRSSGALPR